MSLGEWYFKSAVPPYVIGSFTPHRFFRWNGADPSPVMPAAGQDVDGVAGYSDDLRFAVPGVPFVVEAGAAFGVGANLATDGLGRAAQAGAGDAVVARALESASGSGDVVWAVFASGR